MSRGSIRRRGKASWEIKFDAGRDPVTGKRQTKFVTVKGTRQAAQKELTRLLGSLDGGAFVEPDKVTVADYGKAWLDAATLQPKTKERYQQLHDNQVTPHLGAKLLQKLRPVDIEAWHRTLLARGAKNGKPLSARTAGHAHRFLSTVLRSAARTEVVARNVVALVPPPTVEESEVEILQDVPAALALLAGHELHTIAATALGTGMRRGELLAVAWTCMDLDRARVKVERSLEETRVAGKPPVLRFKPPKTRHGRRTLSLPANVVALLREHRRKQLEIYMALGMGKPAADSLVFCQPDGEPIAPGRLSWRWRNTCKTLGLPKVNFHALRHTHASALISAGLDVVAVSRRLGHGSPAVTLRVYGHMFAPNDEAAALAIDAVMR